MPVEEDRAVVGKVEVAPVHLARVRVRVRVRVASRGLRRARLSRSSSEIASSIASRSMSADLGDIEISRGDIAEI